MDAVQIHLSIVAWSYKPTILLCFNKSKGSNKIPRVINSIAVYHKVHCPYLVWKVCQTPLRLQSCACLHYLILLVSHIDQVNHQHIMHQASNNKRVVLQLGWCKLLTSLRRMSIKANQLTTGCFNQIIVLPWSKRRQRSYHGNTISVKSWWCSQSRKSIRHPQVGKMSTLYYVKATAAIDLIQLQQ